MLVCIMITIVYLPSLVICIRNIKHVFVYKMHLIYNRRVYMVLFASIRHYPETYYISEILNCEK